MNSQQLFAILLGLLQIERTIMQELDALKLAFGTFQGDFATFNADVQTKLAALAAAQTTVADRQALLDMATAFDQMDTTVKALDAGLNPAPAPTTAP